MDHQEILTLDADSCDDFVQQTYRIFETGALTVVYIVGEQVLFDLLAVM